MKRSVVLLTLATLLLAALAYGAGTKWPLKEAPGPDERVFFPPSQNLREAFGKSAEQTIVVLGTIYAPGPIFPLVQAAPAVLQDEDRYKEMVLLIVRASYANITEDRVRQLASEALKSLRIGGDEVLISLYPAPGSVGSALPVGVQFRVEEAQPRTSERPLCRVLLVTNEPELGIALVTNVCESMARSISFSELRLAQDALSKAKANLEEFDKKAAELEPRRKELEEKYKFHVRGVVGDENALYVGETEFTGPLRDKLAKLQELQFGNDLRSASVQAQLEYVRTALAKERQELRLGSGGPSEPFTINPAWSSLKQRLVELETESVGLKATGDRLKQMLTETQGALNDAAEYLSLEKTLGQLGKDKQGAEADLERLQPIVARIEREGPLPVPYVVESTRPPLPPTAPEPAVSPGAPEGIGAPGPTPKP